MSREYDNHPVINEAIEAAVPLTVELRWRQSASIEELADRGGRLHIRHFAE
jgi:hypothetical protein